MDIQHLVDRLEDLIDEGRHFTFTKFTLIDEERALEIIDQMRISVPEQIEKASRLINKRDKVLAHAREEADRIVQVAQQQSDSMTNRDAIVQTAQNRATNIIEQARREAEIIRAEADNYVMDVLKALEDQLSRNLDVARNGIIKIEQDREASRAQIQVAYQQAAADVAAQVAAQVQQFAQQRAQSASNHDPEEISIDATTHSFATRDAADD